MEKWEQELVTMGRNLQRIRKMRGYSLQEAARAVSIDERVLRQAEEGVGGFDNFYADQFLTLCQLYGVSPQWIFTDTDAVYGKW